MNDTPIVVWHVASMGNWREVVIDQLRLLRDVGLTEVRLTHVGQQLGWILSEADRHGIKVTVVRSDPNTDHYETFAMMEVERLCKVEQVTRPILYFHTKGVSYPVDRNRQVWRKVMQEHLIRNWRKNVEYLQSYDAVGVNHIWWGEQHFSGNFWLARSDWIRGLSDFVPFHHSKNLVRYSCELWLLSRTDGRVKSLVCSGQPFWEGGYNFHQWIPYSPSDRPTITWVSGASKGYESDLSQLVASAECLGEGHKLIIHRWDSSVPFRHTLKFDLLRDVLRFADTSHVFWIDADCEFVYEPEVKDITNRDLPLTATRHLGYNSPFNHLPDNLKSKLQHNGNDLYWQSCLFGGTVSAMGDMLEDLRWMDQDGVTYDEHGLVIYWHNNKHLVNTLPCRYASPTTFRNFPDLDKPYTERCGGEPIIYHHNRDNHRKTFSERENGLRRLAGKTRVWNHHGPENTGFGLIQLCRDWIRPGMTVVEIGSYQGVSTCILAEFAKEVYAIDCWSLAPAFGYTEIDERSLEEAEKIFDRSCTDYTNIRKCKGRSISLSENFQNGTLDMMYIDGAHDRDNFLLDCRYWIPKIKIGGVLAGHDYNLIKDYVPLLGLPEPTQVYEDTSWVVYPIPDFCRN